MRLLGQNETMADPQDIETSPKIPRALKVDKVLKIYNKDTVYKMEFYRLADETDRFTFSCTTKRVTRKFVGTISFH